MSLLGVDVVGNADDHGGRFLYSERKRNRIAHPPQGTQYASRLLIQFWYKHGVEKSNEDVKGWGALAVLQYRAHIAQNDCRVSAFTLAREMKAWEKAPLLYE